VDADPPLGPPEPCRHAGFLSALVLPYDQRVAARWGDLQARAQLRGRPRPVNDTWIAARCLVRGLPLATFNAKDYMDFAEHENLELLLR
jgi:predicted nucleic acid-binding protein